ncbi:unnamed protein product [Dovyalis caffra]|uniref:B-like cyclin n=1 Tax=Dovyalis caffra TaxID=77055 RepID=A0AAV1SRF7_9ROSI|nr:unnamed protein product [Dovyalis caffra]
MKKEKVLPSDFGYIKGPITRAAALRASGKMPPLKAPAKEDWKRILRANPKRAALDENSTSGPDNSGNQRKKRAVLQDVTNAKIAKQAKKRHLNVSKIAPRANSKKKIVCQEVKREPYSEVVHSSTSGKDVPSQPSGIREFGTDDPQLPNQCSRMPSHPYNSPKKEKSNVSENWKISSDRDFIDIDSDHMDPQLCSLYAADIYSNLRVAELVRRSPPTFMEAVQRDITQSMRGILVDWLVEHEVTSHDLENSPFSFVPILAPIKVGPLELQITLNYPYREMKPNRINVTVDFITAINIKYEEICSPHVEEFCFITDNTYTSVEVLGMETQVLNFFGFQIFAPTAKTFLRRFLRAAQASYKNPSYELEYLADYLTELTLVDYSFLNFLPSVIAASSVFLARWTLDQTSHPWSPTLEHYTSYKASDLKTTVLALQDLQLNTNGCPLNAIRTKYRQPKISGPIVNALALWFGLIPFSNQVVLIAVQICGGFVFSETA